MPTIIRANDPHAADKRHQTLTLLGKLCDHELSVKTQQDIMTQLTAQLRGVQVKEHDLAIALGTECKVMTDPDTKLTTLLVHVPKEFVSASIQDDRDNQWIQFDINRALNLKDLHGDTAYFDDAKDTLNLK